MAYFTTLRHLQMTGIAQYIPGQYQQDTYWSLFKLMLRRSVKYPWSVDIWARGLFHDVTSFTNARDSSVDIATHYELHCAGIECRQGMRFSAPVQTGPGAYPVFCTMVPGHSPGVNWLRGGVDHPSHLALRLRKE